MLINVIIKLLDLFISKGVDLGTTVKLMGLSIPYLLVLTIPMSVLLGILTGMSRMSADSEITAMKASGISIHRMMPAVMVFALCGYIATSACYVSILPKTNLQLKQLKFDILRTQSGLGIKPHVFYTEFIHMVIYIDDLDHKTGRMKGVFIADNRNDDQPLVIVAETAEQIADPEKNVVTLRLHKGCTHELIRGKQNRYSITPFTTMDLNLNMTIFHKSEVSKSDREMTIGELLQQAEKNKLRGRNNSRQWVEIWKKTALPFACLVFALIGVPLGITTRRGGKSASFAYAIGLILLYYIFLTAGTGLAEEGKLSPFLATWLPNIVIGALGLYLYRLVANEGPANIFSRMADAASIYIIAFFQKRKSRKPAAVYKQGSGWRLPAFRILDRYLSGIFLRIFGYVLAALLAISLIVHSFEKVDKLIEYKARVMDSLIAIGMTTPYFAYLAIPFATLVATILAIGALNKTSELTAMKASGISYMRITLPLLVFGMVITGFTMFLHESIIPSCNRKVEKAWDRIKKRERTKFVRYHRWYRGKNGDFYYFQHYDPREEKIRGFSQFTLDSSMNLISRIEAEEMVWKNGYWDCLNGRIITFDKDQQIDRDVAFKEHRNDIPETPKDFSKEYKESEEMNLRELAEYIKVLRSIGFDTSEYEVDWHAKLSIPFLSVIMVIIGLAFSSQNPRGSGGLKGIGAAILLGAVYFLMFRIGLEIGHAGKLMPFLAAWLCNFVFLILGILFLYRATRLR